MLIDQLSVFLENKKGRLYAVVDALAQSGIDISALSLADTSDFGILRLLVNDPDRAKEVLSAAGVTVSVTKVVAVAMDDVPGGTVGILRLLSSEDINIEYTYACVGKVSGKALMLIRADDAQKAEALLEAHGFNTVPATDIYRI